ncbi:hypothetical protein QE152_g6728 [Popillia japonica]|uniref:Uncharacterized protein n=1 Tax=Popillia japonica TaxID=7064 RepID=A0AAW1MHK9_POPJA
MSWTCTACRGGSNDVITELKNAIFGLTKEITELKSQLAASVPTETGTYNYEELIHEIEERQSRRCNIVVPASVPTETGTYNYEELIHEIEERQSRRCNIVVQGIAESTAPTKTERHEYEKESISKIIKFLYR